MAGNKKISQLVDGGAGQAGDNYVIERGGVNFKVDQSGVSGNPGGLLLNGVVNDMIVKDEKGVVALEQRITLPRALSFVDNTAVPPTEVNGDIYLLDDTGATNAAWDGAATNSWVRFDGTAGLWKEITAVSGFLCTLNDTGDVRHFDPTTSVWEIFGAGTPAGANTEIQFNAAGVFGASSLFTFDTGFGVFSCDAAAVFNDGGTDQDFRIESNTLSNAFFVQGSDGFIGFGSGTPTQDLHALKTKSGSVTLLLENAETAIGAETSIIIGQGNRTDERGNGLTLFANSGGTNIAQIDMKGSTAGGPDGQISMFVKDTAGVLSRGFIMERSRLSAFTNIVFASPSAILHVVGDATTRFFAVGTATLNAIEVPSSQTVLFRGKDDLVGTAMFSSADNTGNTVFTINNGRNIGLGTLSTGTNGVLVFTILNGTAPTTDVTDAIQIFSDDATVGDAEATLGLFTEQGVEAIGTFTPSHKLAIWINGVEYRMQLDAV